MIKEENIGNRLMNITTRWAPCNKQMHFTHHNPVYCKAQEPHTKRNDKYYVNKFTITQNLRRSYPFNESHSR